MKLTIKLDKGLSVYFAEFMKAIPVYGTPAQTAQALVREALIKAVSDGVIPCMTFKKGRVVDRRYIRPSRAARP